MLVTVLNTKPGKPVSKIGDYFSGSHLRISIPSPNFHLESLIFDKRGRKIEELF